MYITHYFHLDDAPALTAPPVEGLLYEVGDTVFIDRFNVDVTKYPKGVWLKLLRKKSVVHNVKRANVHWDAVVVDHP